MAKAPVAYEETSKGALRSVIYWVRSRSSAGKDRVPMYYCGRLTKDTDEGRRGDVRARPVRLGRGEYTAVYAPDDFEFENGDPVFVEGGGAHESKGAAEEASKAVDEDALENLDLYIENESPLYPQKKAIIANLSKKINAGTYDPEKAPKFWSYWVDEGAKRYAKEFGGGEWYEIFSKPTRDALALRLAQRYYEEIRTGEWQGVLEGANEARHAYRYADVSFNYLEDAKKFAALLEKKYPTVAVYVGGTEHGGTVTTNATFEQIVGLLAKHTWKGTYGLSSNAQKMDLVAETKVAEAKEGCSHAHPPEVPSLPCAEETASVTWTKKNTKLSTWFERDRAYVGLSTLDGRAIFDLWDDAVQEAVEDGFLKPRDFHGSAVEWANSLGMKPIEPKKQHEARDVVPSATSEFATLKRDPPPQDVVRKWGTLDGPRKIYDICKSLQTETGECFLVIGIDVQGQVIPADGKPGILIARGQMDRVGVEPNDVAQAIAVLKPAGYVLVHQHPSGRAAPSKADQSLTASIRKSVTTSTYVDHVVIGNGEFHSMRDGKTYKA
jgi:RadC-like JAB domain